MSVEVSNSFGDTSTADLPVHVVSADNQQVQIGLTPGIVYLQQGAAINPSDYIESVTDSSGGSLDVSGVSAESNVDPDTPGCYEIHYMIDGGETWLTVIVEGGGE